MEYSQELQEVLNSCGWSIEMLGYASNLLNIHYKLQKNKDLYKLKSIDFFPEQTSVTLRKLAHCIGSKSSHWVNKKDQLIHSRIAFLPCL